MEAQRSDAASLFHDPSAPWRKRLLAVAERLPYKKGTRLFQQGEPATAVWMVLKGWVHLVRTPESRDGARAVVLFTITPREALCGVSALEAGHYTASGIAATDSLVLRIPSEVFRAALRH